MERVRIALRLFDGDEKPEAHETATDEYSVGGARQIIAAIHPGLLDGSAVVMPKEPTEAMIEAHQGECAGDADEAGPERIKQCWSAMLAAAIEARSEK